MASDVSMAATVNRGEQQRNSVKDAEQAFPLGYALMGAEQETMADRLIRFRAMKGWSYAQAAAAYGVTRTAVWKWEHGETQKIGFETLARIAAVHGTDVPYIVWGEDRTPNPSPGGSPPIDRSGRFKKL